jgi:hypothetical protein
MKGNFGAGKRRRTEVLRPWLIVRRAFFQLVGQVCNCVNELTVLLALAPNLEAAGGVPMISPPAICY